MLSAFLVLAAVVVALELADLGAAEALAQVADPDLRLVVQLEVAGSPPVVCRPLRM